VSFHRQSSAKDLPSRSAVAEILFSPDVSVRFCQMKTPSWPSLRLPCETPLRNSSGAFAWNKFSGQHKLKDRGGNQS
jgi:hypothetical protein